MVHFILDTYYIGDRLLGEDHIETDNSKNYKIRYMYDQEGIAGARYYASNGVYTDYEYVKDGYGNVVAIVKDNAIVVRYVYDFLGGGEYYKNSS